MGQTIKLVIAWIVIAVTTHAFGLGVAQELEPYLRGPQGAYHGRVMDVVTSQPVTGALVLIFWDAPAPAIYGLRWVVVLRELLTDSAGEFFLDASEIENGLLPEVFPPRVVIYKSGYTIFPKEVSTRIGEPAARFSGQGETVWVRSLSRPDDRIEAFNTFVVILNRLKFARETPIPESMRVIKEELDYFGIKPVEPGRKE